MNILNLFKKRIKLPGFQQKNVTKSSEDTLPPGYIYETNGNEYRFRNTIIGNTSFAYPSKQRTAEIAWAVHNNADKYNDHNWSPS